jgi:hypothetical protein
MVWVSFAFACWASALVASPAAARIATLAMSDLAFMVSPSFDVLCDRWNAVVRLMQAIPRMSNTGLDRPRPASREHPS